MAIKEVTIQQTNPQNALGAGMRENMLSRIPSCWEWQGQIHVVAAAFHYLLSRHTESNPRPITADLHCRYACNSNNQETQQSCLILGPDSIPDVSLDVFLARTKELTRKLRPRDGIPDIEHGRGDNIGNGHIQHMSCLEANEVEFGAKYIPDASSSSQAEVSPAQPQLHFVVSIHSDHTTLETVYDHRKFDYRLVQHVSAQLEHVVHQFSSLPGSSKLSQLSFHSPFDSQRIAEWNSRPPPCVDDVVTARFDRQVRKRPSALAVMAWDANLTYRDLDEYSSRLAHHIRHDVTRDQVVLLCFDKSAAAICAMVAVLRAGGACANLNPTHPAERHKMIYNACQSRLILCSPAYKTHLDDIAADTGTVLSIDTAALSALSPVTPDSITKFPIIEPESLAYILFTSGTTGQPKAIAVEHGSLCTSAENHGAKWHIGTETRVLQFSSYSFDVSVADVFFSIMRGACICSPSETERLEDLAGAATRMGANWAFLTPSVASTISPTSMPSLKFLLVGGEAPTRSLVQQWAPHVDLVICTGPAEGSIYCMGTDPVTPDADPANVGRAIGGRLWITEPDDPMKLAPFGAVGELTIEGRIVSRGYLNDPDRTSQAFLTRPPYLPYPFQTADESLKSKVYRTGDLVQYSPDGTIRMIGRRDGQVKIRGQRVELGEIEERVRQGCSWASGVKVLHSKRDGSDSVAAFLVTGADSCPFVKNSGKEAEVLTLSTAGLQAVADIERYIQQFLPEYMLPRWFVPIRKMPKTPNDKLDVRKLHEYLQAFVISITQEQHKVVLPVEGQAEEQMAKLWTQILGLESGAVGRDSHFFKLGGDSLTAIKLTSLAAQSKLKLGYVTITQNPILKDMAVVAGILESPPKNQSLAAFTLLDQYHELGSSGCQTVLAEQLELSEASIEDAYPCVPMQEALMSLSMVHPGSYTTRTVWSCPSNLNLERFKESWSSIYAANDILRTRIILDDDTGSWLQVVVQEPLTWNTSTTETVDAPEFGLGEPLIQCSIIEDRRLHGKSQFVLDIHHAIYDGFSMRLMLDNVIRIYNGQDIPQALPFKSFVAYRCALDEQAAAEFWQSNLQNVVHPRQWATSKTGEDAAELKHLIVSLSREELPKTSEFTLPTRLMASFGKALSKLLCMDDVCFGITQSGRNTPLASIEQIAGPTMTTFPFRLKLQNGMSMSQLCSYVQNQLTEIIPHQHYGMQNMSSLGRDAEVACAFPAMIIIQTPKQLSLLDDLLGDPQHSEEVVGEYPLLLECNMSDHEVVIDAQYDPAIVSAGEVKEILDNLAVDMRSF